MLRLGIIGLLIVSVITAGAALDRPLVHPLFSEGMVVQRDVPITVWGWSEAGQKITVTLAGKTAETTVVAEGSWRVKIGPFAAGGPHELVISGPQSLTIKDVLVGDVWICSGQSNMEMGIGACNAPDDIAQANFPQIRLLTVPRRVAIEPETLLAARWLPCSPVQVQQGLWGGFSATGFYFGRQLHQELHIPIGLIHSSWGGTIAEAWTGLEGLSPLADFKTSINQFTTAVAGLKKQGGLDYGLLFDEWYQVNDTGTMQQWWKPETDVGAWKVAENMPRSWESSGLPDYDGIVWFQRSVEIPAAWTGKDLELGLGWIDDMDTTWFNGVRVGATDRHDVDRIYKVPAAAIRSGTNIITFRVLDTGGDGGLMSKPEHLFIKPVGEAQGVSLAGTWRMKDTISMSKLPRLPQRIDGGNPNVTTVLYNGMIAPLVPFSLKGAIWYQGESNAGRAWQYRSLLPAMITDWRSRFGVGDFPFYIVQLAAWQEACQEPRDHEWAELREAQAVTAKTLPNAGLAVAIDLGDAKDIHPRNKREVGRRLALCALANTYGKKITWSGPWFRAMEPAGQAIRLRFDHVGQGLVARNDRLTGFSIAGENRTFVWADAKIDGDTVLVSSPQVTKPVAVRYAWDINPACGLANKDGLPAVPFRTDDWPAITMNNH